MAHCGGNKVAKFRCAGARLRRVRSITFTTPNVHATLDGLICTDGAGKVIQVKKEADLDGNTAISGIDGRTVSMPSSYDVRWTSRFRIRDLFTKDVRRKILGQLSLFFYSCN